MNIDKSLNLYILRERKDCVYDIDFKAIHAIAPTNLSDRIVMNVGVNKYDTSGSNMELYPCSVHTSISK